MANVLDKVKTIVILMFENRSFDHMLGHLKQENINPAVEGLKDPLIDFKNIFNGVVFPVFKIHQDVGMNNDLPHKKDQVTGQMQKSPVTGKFTMNGFVEEYSKAIGQFPGKECDPMGFFPSSLLPVTSFLARTFCTCDNWFTPIPTGTQPNRNMAFSGDSFISDNSVLLRIGEKNIFDWLNSPEPDKKVRWRVYHSGISYFLLYPSLLHHVFGSNFRSYSQLAVDIQSEPEDTAPEVIIIEPVYKDAPHVSPVRANDNHPPLAVGWGEDFLRRTYEALSSNQKKWESTVFLVYYDEHGGFYDHVLPPEIKFKIQGGTEFDSLGPRIPAIIASPLVNKGSVCHHLFDHTSVLQFLAEKFTPGKDYSEAVKSRRLKGIESISVALDNPIFWPAPPPPSQPISVPAILGSNISEGPQTDVAEAFEVSVNEILLNHNQEGLKKFPELAQWKISADNAIR